MVAKQKSHYSKKCCNCPRSPLFNQSLCMTGIDSFIITHGNWAEKNIPPCAVFNWLQVTCCRSWLLYVRHVLIPFTKHSEFKIGERTRTWSEMASTVSNGNDRLRDGKLRRRLRQKLNHHYGRAKKVLRALQTNLTNERRTKEIRSQERFRKHTKC